MRVLSMYAGSYGCNSYVVISDDASEAVLVDPSVSNDFVFRQCSTLPPIRKILLTHAHFDHVICLEQWLKDTDVKVYATHETSLALSDAQKNGNLIFFGTNKIYPEADVIVEDGEIISFGNSSLKVLKTPGHTFGSCCYYSNDIAFTGDTLFADGDVGRTDLCEGSLSLLKASIHRIFDTLDKETVIYPGHGEQSTIKKEAYNHHII